MRCGERRKQGSGIRRLGVRKNLVGPRPEEHACASTHASRRTATIKGASNCASLGSAAFRSHRVSGLLSLLSTNPLFDLPQQLHLCVRTIVKTLGEPDDGSTCTRRSDRHCARWHVAPILAGLCPRSNFHLHTARCRHMHHQACCTNLRCGHPSRRSRAVARELLRMRSLVFLHPDSCVPIRRFL